VKTTHLGYKKTIKTVSNMNARQYKFYADEFKREVTVEEYFMKSNYFTFLIYFSSDSFRFF